MSAAADSANQAADSAKLDSAIQAADTLDLLTLSTEFNAQIVVHNYKDFDSLAVDGVALKDSMASVPVSKIAKDAFLTLSWKRGGSRGSLLLRTLHKLVPNMTVTQDLSKGPMSAGDFYLSYVYLRLIQKIGNNGQYLFYRFEPKVDTSGNCTGWWDFKKHHGDDGKIYYSYHEPDSTYASWRFNGFNPGKRILLDVAAHNANIRPQGPPREQRKTQCTRCLLREARTQVTRKRCNAWTLSVVALPPG